MASSINASTSGAGGVITTADNTGILNLQTASTTAVTVDASQNVGIGTSSPAYRLQTFQTGGASISALFQTDQTDSYISFRNTTNASNSSTRIGAAGNDISFLTASSERMRIDSSGTLLMGTTSASGWALGTGGVAVKTAIAGNQCFTAWNADTSGTRFLAYFGTGSSFTNVGAITTNGTSTSYVTSSDYRLKEDIAPMTGALATVQALKPVTYKWKVDGSDGQGFIAHELQAIVPDAVVGEKDAVDAEGNPIHQGVDTSFLVATLTAAIQEQQTIINDLKARIETLEAK
jgi:hypothetical protein